VNCLSGGGGCGGRIPRERVTGCCLKDVETHIPLDNAPTEDWGINASAGGSHRGEVGRKDAGGKDDARPKPKFLVASRNDVSLDRPCFHRLAISSLLASEKVRRAMKEQL